jgi:hypothetical protein
MSTKYIILPLLFFLSFIASNNYAQEEEKQKVNYRRIDPNNFPFPEDYQQPKEQVFPLGYGT